MCNKFKFCQIVDNDLRWSLTHILQDANLSGVKIWPEKLVYMLFCLLASLICTQNKTFKCLKHVLLNSWNSNMSTYLFSYFWSGEWYHNDFCVKMIHGFSRIHWQQNHYLARWRHQPHLPMLGHILFFLIYQTESMSSLVLDGSTGLTQAQLLSSIYCWGNGVTCLVRLPLPYNDTQITHGVHRCFPFSFYFFHLLCRIHIKFSSRWQHGPNPGPASLLNLLLG